MVRRLLLAAVFLGLAGAAAAQPQDAPIIETYGREPPPPPGPRVRLFVSPMGEPFRGPDGFGTWLAGADADHDGAVTLAEFRADAERFFHVLDTDGNGFIDGFEMQAYERDLVPEIASMGVDDGGRGARRGFGGGGGGRRGGGAHPPQPGGEAGKSTGAGQTITAFKAGGRDGAARYSLLNIPQPVAQADEDWNGRVTLQEWDHAATRRFALLDKANTGRLTRDSLQPPAPEKDKKPEKKKP
jgi:hypothetical protein